MVATGPDRALRSTFVTNMVLAGLAVATGILAARLLGPSGEGELAAIMTWSALLGTLAMLGLPEALTYFIARQPERGKQLTTTAVLIGLLSSLVVGAAAWFAMPFLLSAQQPEVVSAARVFLLIGCIFAVVGIPHGALRGARELPPGISSASPPALPGCAYSSLHGSSGTQTPFPCLSGIWEQSCSADFPFLWW